MPRVVKQDRCSYGQRAGRGRFEGSAGIIAAVVFALLWGLPAWGEITFIFEEGFGGYVGTADTSFFTGVPERVAGENASWEWDTGTEGGASYGVIRFDNIVGDNPGQIPPNSNVISAILSLHVVGPGDPSQIATFHELIVPFTEEMDMFEFSEGWEPFPGEQYDETILAEIPGPTSGDVLELDVTSTIKKVVAGQDYFGWIFIPGGSNGVDVASSEAARGRPRLIVVIEGTAPEVTRTVSPQSYYLPGETINVSLVVTLPSGTMDIKIVETIQTGWTVTNISHGGTFAAGTVTWNLTGFSGSDTLSYVAVVPADAGPTVEFSGLVNDKYFIFGDSTAVFQPPFVPIGPVDVNPGEVVIIHIENATPLTEERNYRLEGDPNVKSGVILRSLIDGRVTPLRPEDEVQITINITQAGNYYLFASCASDSGDTDSFFVGMDGDIDNDNWYRFNLGPDDGQFHVQWVTSHTLGDVVEYPLDAGQHVINWHMREPDSRVDWVGITDNWELDLTTVVEPEPVSVDQWSIY